jgi:natural product precursor
MKSKKLMQKLTLKKQTIASLDHDEMKRSKGGFTVEGRPCSDTREICSDLLSCHPYC